MSQSLPTTSYIKMIDIWMIFSMLYPFFVVSLYSIMEVLKNKKNKIQTSAGDWIEKGHLMNSRSVKTVAFLLDWGLPLLVIIFIIIYCSLGLVNYTYPDVDNIC